MYMQKLHTYSIWQAYRFVPKEPVQDFPLLLLLKLLSLPTYIFYLYLTYTYLGGTCTWEELFFLACAEKG